MKTLNLNSKVIIIPISQLPEDVVKSLKQQDGPQYYNDVELFVYATENPEKLDCECEEECSEECDCHCQDDPCGCEDECSEECECGCQDESCECIEECGEECDCSEEDHQMGAITVVDEPVVILDSEDAAAIGFEVTDDMLFNISEDGITLVPGSTIGNADRQTNAITITVD